MIAPAAGPFLAGRSVRLVFLERRTRACLDAVRDGSADLAFGLGTRFREEPDVEVLHVVADRHVVVLPRTHPLAEKALLRFSETLAYPYVSAPRSAPIGAAMAERAEALGIDYAPVAEMPSFALMLELVLQGAGLAIMPKAAVTVGRDPRTMRRLSLPPTASAFSSFSASTYSKRTFSGEKTASIPRPTPLFLSPERTSLASGQPNVSMRSARLMSPMLRLRAAPMLLTVGIPLSYAA